MSVVYMCSQLCGHVCACVSKRRPGLIIALIQWNTKSHLRPELPDVANLRSKHAVEIQLPRLELQAAHHTHLTFLFWICEPQIHSSYSNGILLVTEDFPQAIWFGHYFVSFWEKNLAVVTRLAINSLWLFCLNVLNAGIIGIFHHGYVGHIYSGSSH